MSAATFSTANVPWKTAGVHPLFRRDVDVGNVLWCRRPAEVWTEALPIGNGRLGAMVYGGIENELISLNEDTLYCGEPYAFGSVPIHAHVDRAFELIKKGQYANADQYVSRNMLGNRSRVSEPF